MRAPSLCSSPPAQWPRPRRPSITRTRWRPKVPVTHRPALLQPELGAGRLLSGWAASWGWAARLARSSGLAGQPSWEPDRLLGACLAAPGCWRAAKLQASRQTRASPRARAGPDTEAAARRRRAGWPARPRTAQPVVPAQLHELSLEVGLGCLLQGPARRLLPSR